jgi:Neuraminidase (sialidase)
VYYWNTMHVPHKSTDSKGIIRMSRSTDNGETWLDAETIADFGSRGVEVRDPNLCLLADGTLLLTFFSYAFQEQTELRQYTQTYVCRSEDHGNSWSEPELVKNSNLWNAKQGTMALLGNGDLLMATYGSRTHNNDIHTYRLSVMRSIDGGRTWNEEAELADSTAERAYNESCMVDLGPNGVYCLSRERGDLFHSQDAGHTWTFIEGIELVQRPHFLKIDNDRVFTTWCDPQGVNWKDTASNNRKVIGRLFDVRIGWDKSVTKTIYDPPKAGIADMGYPSSVLLDDQTILTVYYNSRIGVVAGTVTTLEEW